MADEFEDEEVVETSPAQAPAPQPAQPVAQQAVKQPKEKNECSIKNWSLDVWAIILSFAAITLKVIALFFAVVNVPIAATIFAFLGYGVIIAAMVVLFVNILKNKKIEFSPALVVVLLSIFTTFAL